MPKCDQLRCLNGSDLDNLQVITDCKNLEQTEPTKLIITI